MVRYRAGLLEAEAVSDVASTNVISIRISVASLDRSSRGGVKM
jgi:hypothetical protein